MSSSTCPPDRSAFNRTALSCSVKRISAGSSSLNSALRILPTPDSVTSGAAGWENTPDPWKPHATGSLPLTVRSKGSRSRGPRAESLIWRIAPGPFTAARLAPVRVTTATDFSPEPDNLSAPVARPCRRKAPVVADPCTSAEMMAPSLNAMAPDTFSPPASATRSCSSKPPSVKRNAALPMASPNVLLPVTETAPSTSWSALMKVTARRAGATESCPRSTDVRSASRSALGLATSPDTLPGPCAAPAISRPAI